MLEMNIDGTELKFDVKIVLDTAEAAQMVEYLKKLV